VLKTGHPVEPEELMAYLDGELEAARASLVVAHLEQCADCAALAGDLRGLSRELTGWEVEPAEIREIPGAAPRKRRLRFWWWKAAAVGVVAVGVLAVIGVRSVQRPAASQLTTLHPSPQYETSPTVTPTLRSEGYTEQTGDITLRLIARTAQLELATKDFERARLDMDGIVSRHHGYIGEMTARADNGTAKLLTAQLQIPAAERAAAITDLKRIARVVAETQTAEDVSKQSADLDARLANARISEARLRELLRLGTGTVSAVVEVERELSRIRGEIEHMEAERRGMNARVEMTTVSVTIREEVAGGSLTTAAQQGWRNVGGGLEEAAEIVLAYGPVAILWAGLLVLPARWGWRRWCKGRS
jgi:Domain of unknown function (DUF4349)/Putative zinc-finger